MPALTKKKKGKTARQKPFTGLYDRHGQVNLQVGKENPGAKATHKLLKKSSRKRKGSSMKAGENKPKRT